MKLLRKGARVHLMQLPRTVKDGEPFDESTIDRAGEAGFTVELSSSTYWWHDRGKTWSSLQLDRNESIKHSFSEAAKAKQ